MRGGTIGPARGTWAVLAALALAAGTVVVTLRRALDDPAPSASPPSEAIVIPRIDLVTRRSATDLRAALGDDPFSPDRSPPPTRYHRPGSPERPTTTHGPAAPTVLGTVIATDGRSFAICVLGGEPPTLVYVGGKIGSYLVDAIGRGHVVFVTRSGRRIDVRATQTSD